MMLREFTPIARRLAIACLVVVTLAGCGIKGPLKAPPGSAAAPAAPPGVELPSATERHD